MGRGFSATAAALLGTGAAVASGAALAHVGVDHHGADHVHGFSAGFAHPFTGLDHLLVMIAVGLYAVRATARPLLLPGVFLAFMAVGGALGVSGIPIAFAEEGILASVAIMAVLALAAPRMPMMAIVPLVAAFAVLHGFAHGAEMAVGAGPFGYAAGFLIGTALLHGLGMALGRLLPRGRRAASAG